MQREAQIVLETERESLVAEYRRKTVDDMQNACAASLFYNSQAQIEAFQQRTRFLSLMPNEWILADSAPRPHYCCGSTYEEYLDRETLLIRIKQFGGKWKKTTSHGYMVYTRTEQWNGFSIVFNTSDTPPGCQWEEVPVTSTKRVLKCHGPATPDVTDEASETNVN